MKRLMVFMGVLTVLTAGCSGSHNAASDKSASHKSTSVPNDLAGTSWLKVLDQIQPNGTVSTATALDAFALAIGPLPGVTPPPGRTVRPDSGTLALDWVFAHWNQLSPAQQQTVLTDIGAQQNSAAPTQSQAQRLSPASSSAVHTAAATTSPNLACLTADSAGAAFFRDELGGILNDFVTHFGYVLTLDAVTRLLQLLGVSGGTDGSGLLAAGTWKCAGNSLSVSPPAGNGASGAWTWARTGG